MKPNICIKDNDRASVVDILKTPSEDIVKIAEKHGDAAPTISSWALWKHTKRRRGL